MGEISKRGLTIASEGSKNDRRMAQKWKDSQGRPCGEGEGDESRTVCGR